MGLFDTIYALITAPGRGAVAVFRVSGPEAVAAVREVFNGLPAQPESHRAYFGKFSHGDEGLALYFAVGRGYTGEESLELSIHGTPRSIELMAQHLTAAGIRPAEPGEFTRRAFMHGRLDLTQAEAVRDTYEAQTLSQFRAASRVRQGELHERLKLVGDALMKALATIEASVDFSDEVGPLDRPASVEMLQEPIAHLDSLLATARFGRIQREGVLIALIGPPNAGKSSLLNRVLGQDRALVSNIPGTTRDTIEELVDLDGLPARLVDTAGLRESDDEIERLGIGRSQQAMANADLIWFVVDGPVGLTPRDEEVLASLTSPCLVVWNKIDLAPAEKGVGVSARTGEGLVELVRLTKQTLMGEWSGDETTINARHKPLLERARAGIMGSVGALQSDAPDDLAVVGLQDALVAIQEITGERFIEGLLDRIFHDFCIGK